MNRLDATARTSTLLSILCVMYAFLDMNVVFLAPILTIVIPYKFMKEKDDTKTKENRRIFSNLFLFNIISFIAVMLVTNKSGLDVTELVTNILITFVYFQILSSMEKKRENVFENPELEYEKINQKITALEMMYAKAQEDVEKAKNEKVKTSSQVKADTIKTKIDEAKQQMKFLENQIELKNNKEQHQ